MDRPKLEVADVFRRYGEAYRDQHGASMSSTQRRVMKAIEVCRTAALGGHVERCDTCAHERISNNSCSDRHCPKCQSLARAGGDCRHRLPAVYGILFHATAETLRTIAAEPKHLGAEIGFFAVLHTWGQNLMHHWRMS